MPAITEANDTNHTQQRLSRSINKKIDLLDRKVDSLYKDIYTTRTDNKKNLDDIIDSIDDTIDKLQGIDSGASGMTELLRRVDKQNGAASEKLISSVQELFSDNNLIGNIVMNDDVHRYIKAQNYNFDLICRYLPRLQDALNIKKDNVLCSDSFDKEFLMPQSPSILRDNIAAFEVNADKLEREYDLSDFLEETYDRTSKYGEDFIYIVPYKEAFRRLFSHINQVNMSGLSLSPTSTLFEGYSEIELLGPNFAGSREFISFTKGIDGELGDIAESALKNMPELGGINLYFNMSGTIRGTVNEFAVAEGVSTKQIAQSLRSIYEAGRDSNGGLTSIFNDKIAKDSRKPVSMGGLQNDGLILDKNLDKDPNKIDKNLLGAVLERLPRENVLPLYIGKRCIGYYYFEFADDPSACGFCGGHHSTPGLSNSNQYHYEMSEAQQELAMRFVAAHISRQIDAKFINANKDLKDEIYAILRYNEKFDMTRTNNIGVTFISADDVVHSYFKMDWHTHRGISDLEAALIPAMLYILLYLTDIIGKITRSNDKRVYYVKQNVEQNIARTMMNVIAQIKKGNMGVRQIESMNNILNIVGKYNDYIIPVGPSGDSPIQFDIMQGQDIQTPTDLMQQMEEAAVNTIMPYELVNSTYQQDFATRYTMSNTRFLKTVMTRQRKVQRIFSKIYTPLYNYNFNQSYPEIKIILPPPLFLILQNNSQLLDNTTQMADKISEIEITGDDENNDKMKTEFKKLYVRKNLATYFDYNMIDRLIAQAKVNIETEKPPAVEDGEASGDAEVNDMMDDSL